MPQPLSKAIDRYRKVHALHAGATTPGEAAAADRVLGILRERHPGIEAAAFPPQARAPRGESRVPYADAFTSGIFGSTGHAQGGGWWGRFRDAMDGFTAAEAKVLLDEALDVSARIDRRGGLRAVIRIDPHDVEALLGAISQGAMNPDGVAQAASEILFARLSELLDDETD
mgnify:CR=1 FL=1